MKLREFPVERAANSIIPLCLENFAFVTEISDEEDDPKMLYHNLTDRISELPDINAKKMQLLGRISEIEQPNRILIVNGKWQPKELTELEKLTSENLKIQLSELYFQSESIKFDHHIPDGHRGKATPKRGYS